MDNAILGLFGSLVKLSEQSPGLAIPAIGALALLFCATICGCFCLAFASQQSTYRQSFAVGMIALLVTTTMAGHIWTHPAVVVFIQFVGLIISMSAALGFGVASFLRHRGWKATFVYG